MKLLFIDPHCSGIQCVGCNDFSFISDVLKYNGIDEDQCGGESVDYIFIDKYGNERRGCLDFT